MATRNELIQFLEEIIATYGVVQNSCAYSQSKKQKIEDKLRFLRALLNGLKSPQQMSAEHIEQIRQRAVRDVEDIMAFETVAPRIRGFAPMKQLPNQDDIRPRQQGHELRLHQGQYRVVNLDTGASTVANGGYVFVITVATPWRVLVGQRTNGGHTAISRGSDVYYAGEIEFNNGILQRWTNSSGHYKPQANLHGQASPLLPPDRFEEYQG